MRRLFSIFDSDLKFSVLNKHFDLWRFDQKTAEWEKLSDRIFRRQNGYEIARFPHIIFANLVKDQSQVYSGKL